MSIAPKTASGASAEVWSVSQLTRRVKNLLEGEIGRVWVSGEISNWRVSPAGHAYFTLKDASSQLSAVMFRGKLERLKFEPESGLEVIVNGQVSVYEQRGQYQIICDGMQPQGLGALQLAFDKLKAKLEAEGLFDAAHKKPLPMLPKRIGIVTSPTGAAIRDILHVLERRHANLHILLWPARVQGDGAAADIVAGIRALDEFGVDVMIVGRGGGSLEDLWAFNEEPVVRAVFECRTPIISAVGHEIDFSLSDFAADLRAPTPSAAAEIVVREQDALVQQISALESRLCRVLNYQLSDARHRLNAATSKRSFERPADLLREPQQRLDDARLRLESAMAERAAELRRRVADARRSVALLSPANQLKRGQARHAELLHRLLKAGPAVVDRRRNRFLPAVARLDALSPLAILSRGYALAWKLPDKSLIRSAEELVVNDAIEVRFGKGSATARIENIHPDTDKG